jgi:hypothetical protein
MQLAEVLDVIHRIAAQVQQRVVQHRAVAVRQQEAVAVHPFRIGRVVAVMAAPQGHGDFGHAHRHAWVAGIGLLDGVHCQRADRVSHLGGGSVEVIVDITEVWKLGARAVLAEPIILPDDDSHHLKLHST